MPSTGQPVIIKNKIVYGYMDKATVCRDMGREDYNDLTEAQQLNGDVYFIQGVDASAFAPTNSLWNKVGTTPLDSDLPADCSQAINQLKSNLTDLNVYEKLTGTDAFSNTYGTIDGASALERKGNVVTFSLKLSLTSSRSSWTTLTVIPERFRPKSSINIFTTCWINNGVAHNQWQLLDTGDLRVGTNVSGVISVCFTYVIE